jgi:hypothetical protein
MFGGLGCAGFSKKFSISNFEADAKILEPVSAILISEKKILFLKYFFGVPHLATFIFNFSLM